MGIWQEFRDSISSVVSFPADYFAGFFGVAPSESGVEVNELTAMQIAAYVGCVRIISGAISTLPFRVWETMADGSERLASDHLLDHIINDQPNPEVTAADFWETVMVHVLQTGNAYAEKAYNGAGQPAALYLRSPFRTFPYRRADGSLFYKTNDSDNNRERAIEAEDIVHVKGMGLDSLVGLSPVKYYAREALGIDLAAQSYGAKFFANDSRPGGYLAATAMMAPEKKKEAVKSWIAAHSRGNSHSMALLDGGVTWQKVGVNPEEAQFLQTRKFNREQIAAIFGVPVHFLGESVESRANMEQRGLEFLTYTLKPFLVKIEQAINARMFPTVQYGRNAARKFHAKMDTTMFERATYADLLKGIQIGRYAGVYTIDEARKLLGEQPYSEEQAKSENPADKLWMPVNMAYVSMDVTGTSADTGKGGGAGGDDQDGGDGGGNVPTTTGQGGKRDYEAEIKRYSTLFYPVFRDAVGRIVTRKGPTLGYFSKTFSPVLIQIASAFSFESKMNVGEVAMNEAESEFIQDYASRIFARAKKWEAKNADSIASDELSLAIAAMRKQFQSEAIDEEKPDDSRNLTIKVENQHPIVNLHPILDLNLTIPEQAKPRERKIAKVVRAADGSITGVEVDHMPEQSHVSAKMIRQDDGSYRLQ
jgi:HK97 family phage portal protein